MTGNLILLVDDHAAARRLVRFALERAGLRVVEAETGESALSLARKEKPQLVIQDLALPDIDGFDLVGRLRSLRHDEPLCVLAFSGLISKVDQSRVVAAGFDERNPAVLSLLERAIKACKEQGKYVGICGQGPSDHPDLAEWLLEQGIESMSLNPDTVVNTWLRLARRSG